MYLPVFLNVFTPMVQKSVVDKKFYKHRLQNYNFVADLALRFPRLPLNIIREVTTGILLAIWVDGLTFGMYLSFVKAKTP